MSDFETIIFNTSKRVATITLNRPETMNALSQKMRVELLEAIQEIEANSDIRVVILTGAGRGFSSGTDLTEGLAGYNTVEEKILAEFVPLARSIQQSSKIYLSAVQGACAGITAGLAMLCDLSVMSDSAYLFVPFAGLNLVPDGGVSYQLVRHLGYKRAMEVYTNAEKMSAQRCLEYGLINKVVPADTLQDEARAWAEKLALGAPLAHKLGKQCMQFAMQNDLNDVIAFEANRQIICSTSPDTRAAVEAVLRKEKPSFEEATA